MVGITVGSDSHSIVSFFGNMLESLGYWVRGWGVYGVGGVGIWGMGLFW